MRAVDTNVLVRLVIRDDAKQAGVAETFVADGVWVSQLVLAETMWVLRANYAFDAAGIAGTVEMLLNKKEVFLENADVVAAALDHFRRRPSLRFFDCLILEAARKAGHLPVGTFDKALATLDGTTRL